MLKFRFLQKKICIVANNIKIAVVQIDNQFIKIEQTTRVPKI
jgi:hypothetical protein